MPGSNVTPTRGLEYSGDVHGLLEARLSTEVLEAFHDRNIFWGGGLMSKQMLAPGSNEWRFPIFGESPEDADRHTPGTFIDGGTLVQDRGSVKIDDNLVKALDLPFVDVSMSQWDILSAAGKEIGRILAEKMDKYSAAVAVNAARTAAVTNVHNGGQVITRTGPLETNAYAFTSAGSGLLQDDLADMARLFDEDNIPEDNRFAVMSPRLRSVLTRDATTLMNRDVVPETYTDRTMRKVLTVEGWSILTSKHLPSTNITTGPSGQQGDFRSTGGGGGATGLPMVICLHSPAGQTGAVGAVMSSLGIRSVIQQDEQREVWFTKGSIHAGIDKLAVWMAGEIRAT